MKCKVIFIIALGMLHGAQAIAAVPYSFKGGEPARAADVNANFTDLDGRVQTNTSNITKNTDAIAAIKVPATYDIRDYLPATNVSSATFSISNNPTFNSVTQTYTPNADYSELRVDRVFAYTSGSSVLSKFTVFFGVSAKAFSRNGGITYNADGSENSRGVHDPVRVLFARPASPGASWVTVSDTTTTDATTSQVTGVTSEIITANFAGVESVTVPYNGGTTFQDCLKISEFESLSGGSVASGRTSWYCKNAGLVKRIIANLGNTSNPNPKTVWALTGLTYATP